MMTSGSPNGELAFASGLGSSGRERHTAIRRRVSADPNDMTAVIEMPINEK